MMVLVSLGMRDAVPFYNKADPLIIGEPGIGKSVDRRLPLKNR
jgi:hypothetical protein